MRQVFLLHGPNLNLLGTREPERYGNMSLEMLNAQLAAQAEKSGIELHTTQSQSESTLIDVIHDAYAKDVDYLIFNPAAFTHTSIALRDALLAVQIPFIEVHLSNLHQREAFRQHSYFSDIADGIIQGFGTDGYVLALEAVIRKLT